MQVRGNAVKGITDWAQEVALVFASGAADDARAFVERRRHEATAAEARRMADEANAASESLQPQVTHAHQEFGAVRDAEPEGKGNAQMISWCSVGGAVIFLGLAVGVSPIFVMLAIVAGGAFFYFQSEASKAETEHLTRVNAAKQRYDQLSAQLMGAQEARARHLLTAQEHEQQRDALKPQRRLRAVGRLYVPVTTAKVAGYPIIIDRSGVLPATSLSLPDLATKPEVVARIQRTVAEARDRPMLLRDDGDAPAEVDEVLGEERALRSAVADFTQMVEGIPTIDANLPLVPNDDALARYLARAPVARDTQTVPGALVRLGDDDATARSISDVTEVARRMRALGGQVDRAMRDLYEGLSSVLKDYGDLRSDALDRLHEGLQEILQRSDLAYVTYYCPRCNRVPEYLFHRVGVDIERAHELPPEQLVSALQGDDEARERITRDETLMAEIASAWNSVHELENTIRHWDTVQRPLVMKGGAGVAEIQAFESRMRALRAQRTQAVEQFKGALTRVLTGNARPLLELSKQARLYLDPESHAWSCGACATVFDDPAVARMGRMLKVKDQLMMPMWNHLWTEKDALRKTELFRTNENIQRLIEKEAGALRDVAEQYRADMRAVRENLILATTEAGMKKEQLEVTVQSLQALGAISEDEANAWVGRLMDLTGGDLKDLRKRAEAKETLLNQEPQAQLGRRVPALDPVQTFLTPGALFNPVESGAPALTLGDGKAEVARVG